MQLFYRALITLFIVSRFAYCFPDTTAFEKILSRAHLPRERLGMLVQDDSGPVFAVNADHIFIPASLTKILSAGATLENLGPQYYFKTQLLTDGTTNERRLKGSIYLKGGGDPSFNSAKLDLLIKQFVQTRVKEIDGNLIIDDSGFYDYEFGDWKTAQLAIQNSRNQAAALFVSVDPPANFLPSGSTWQKLDRSVRSIIWTPERDLVVYRNMLEPNLWTGYKILQNLRLHGIRVKGNVGKGNVPLGLNRLAEIRTPLVKILHDMLKSSDNYFAEALTKNLAAATSNGASLEAGLERIRVFLDHVGIPRGMYHLSSGAGFSQQNSISAGSLCKVLDYVRSNMSMNAILLSALPSAGVDGTLKNRMRRSPAQGRVLAKTGYLRDMGYIKGSVGLAGYVFRADGRVLTFAFMYNGPERASVVRNAFDAICIEMAR